jgi:hypothetical protein
MNAVNQPFTTHYLVYYKKIFINSKRITMSTPMEMLDVLRWMKDAACKGNTEANWFPEHGITKEVKLARTICSQCAVKEECLNYAVQQPELLGIWGGTSHRQRRNIRMGRAVK